MEDGITRIFSEIINHNELEPGEQNDISIFDDAYYKEQIFSKRGSNRPFTGSVKVGYDHDRRLTFREASFIDGKLVRLTQWYANGQKSHERYFNYAINEEGLRYITWHQNGMISMRHYGKYGYRFYEDGSISSIFTDDYAIDYWESGEQQTYWPVTSLENFNLNGVQKVWHENGQLGLIGELVNGQRNGEWIEYDSLGNKTLVELYDMGTLIEQKMPPF